MSPYRIALIIFLVATGLLFVFDFGRTTQIIAGVAALVAGGLLLFEGTNTTTRL